MRRLLVTTLLLLGLCAPAFAEEPDEAGRDTVLFPLAPGNSWTIDVTMSSPDGKEKAQTVTLSVTDEVLIAGMRAYRFGPPGDDDVLLANGDGGVRIWDDESAESMLLFPYPAKVGAVHTLGSGPWSDESVRIQVVNTAEEILINGALVTCYHYQMLVADKADASIHIYVAPGIGIVKFDAVIDEGRGTSEIHGILTKYSVRQTPESEPRSDVD
jgi:hypothetical protein